MAEWVRGIEAGVEVVVRYRDGVDAFVIRGGARVVENFEVASAARRRSVVDSMKGLVVADERKGKQ